MTTLVHDLAVQPVHLGLGGRSLPQPPIDGMAWYEAYANRTASDGSDGRLVSLQHFEKDWSGWEMHPAGDELVACIAGEIIVIQQGLDGKDARQILRQSQYLINPAGIWHTANVTATATVLFITPGLGTQHKPRR